MAMWELSVLRPKVGSVSHNPKLPEQEQEWQVLGVETLGAHSSLTFEDNITLPCGPISS